jgi:rhodanese-related sulfurtransferase
MRTVWQFVVIAVSGGLVGLVGNVVRPDGLVLGEPVVPQAVSSAETCAGPESQPRIDVAEALQLYGGIGVAFADVRSAHEYATGHIADALHLPCSSAAPAWLEAISHPTTVVVYGEDGGADQVAQALSAGGYRDVRVLDGGFAAWREGGGASQAGECEGCR